MSARPHRYLIALGSNMRVPGIGGPRAVLGAALASLPDFAIEVQEVSRISASAPIGPSIRRYANGAALVESALDPVDLLDTLQRIEHAFGRRRRGGRWRARPLDLDIILWSGGIWASPDLVIPHPLFRERDFVLRPAAQVAPYWRDPISGLTLRQLAARGA